MKIKSFIAFATAAAATFGLSACGSSSSSDGSSASASQSASASSAGETTKLVVGVSPVPHAQIVQYVKDNLAQKAGLDIQIKEYQDYVTPNRALNDGEIDANFFQHVPYFDEETKTKGYKLEHGDGIHIEPIGIYSSKVKDLKDLPNNAVIAINNDPSNQSRGLRALENAGILTFTDQENPTTTGIASNPKNVTFKVAEAPAIPKLLPDVDAAIINGNFAVENNLTPSKDALYLESGENNPYSNVLAWKKDAPADKLAAIKKLDDLLHSQDVKDYISKTWSDGSVIASF
ncbi:MAG: MetQ/NlpA family ABC transporter substrate-binding protein [Actinomycetaceae bacterium]|nr:MetQ/NlpA family ABC transporter substrate-binding protein [Actinomycetaceae bacterium]MDY6083107.1 MetQ/NlpA family ABC transporter substrate-binding protein [Actinomycetaceae bacterium]